MKQLNSTYILHHVTIDLHTQPEPAESCSQSFPMRPRISEVDKFMVFRLSCLQDGVGMTKDQTEFTAFLSTETIFSTL